MNFKTKKTTGLSIILCAIMAISLTACQDTTTTDIPAEVGSSSSNADALLVASGSISANNDNVSSEAPVEAPTLTISVKAPVITLKENWSSALEAKFSDSTVTSKISYRSSDEKVATVSETGIVSFVGAGEAKITISDEGIAEDVIVVVTCEAVSTEVAKPEVQVITPESKPETPDASKKGDSASINDELIETTPDDLRTAEAGVGVVSSTSYSSGDSVETTLANLQDIVGPAYNITVTESGFFGNGSASNAGNFRVMEDASGRWYICIYNWRKDASNQGMNKTINSALETFKYFLGKENGENLWKVTDNKFTGTSTSLSEYGITEVDETAGDGIGELVFEDGNSITYDFSSGKIQTIFYLT